MSGLKYKDVEAEHKWFAESLGKGVKATALGTIAAVWVVLSTDKVELASAGLLGVPTSLLVKLTFVFASATLLADLLQIVSGFWSVHIGIVDWNKREEAGENVEFYYDETNLGKFGAFLYKANEKLVPIKFLLAICAGASFVSFSFAISLA